MAKSTDFYKRYVVALFHRGKADRLPLEYIEREARKVLSTEEMEALHAHMQEMITQGALTREDDFYTLCPQQS